MSQNKSEQLTALTSNKNTLSKNVLYEKRYKKSDDILSTTTPHTNAGEKYIYSFKLNKNICTRISTTM